MSDRPVRWLESKQAGSLERDLLGQAPSGEPPTGAEQRIWAALALRLPPGPGGEGGGGDGGIGAGAGQTLGTLGALKAAGIGALAGLVVATSAALVDPSDRPVTDPRPAPVAAVITARQPEPAATAASFPEAPARDERRARAFAPRPAAAAAASGAAPTSSVASLEPETRASQLREESQALQAVRTALRRGDGAGALATLEATRARFPASVLGQEREALTIQALALAGQRDAARERARAFISKFPTSPHVPILARFAEPAALAR